MNKTKGRVECPYRNDCCEADSEKCQSCINNKKRSYYRHKDYYPYYPYYPPEPYYPYYWTYPSTTITYWTGDDIQSDTAEMQPLCLS